MVTTFTDAAPFLEGVSSVRLNVKELVNSLVIGPC